MVKGYLLSFTRRFVCYFLNQLLSRMLVSTGMIRRNSSSPQKLPRRCRTTSSVPLRSVPKENSLLQNLSLVSNSSSLNEEVRCLCWILNVHPRIHRSQPPVRCIQCTPWPHVFSRSLSILSLHTCLYLQTWCLSDFVTELTWAFLDSHIHVSRPTHRTVFDFISLMIHVAEFAANIFLSTSVTPENCSCRRMKGHGSLLTKSSVLPPITWL